MNHIRSLPSDSLERNPVFHIKTDRFEGPLELLLELVEKRKLLINDISLAHVTDEYMKTVAVMQERSLPHTAQFIALAATLLLLKSKSLLPVLELTEEETDRIEDLESMLKHYQIFRDAGLSIQNQFGRTVLSERSFIPGKPVFLPDSYCSIATLHAHICDTINELPTQLTKPKVQVKPTISLEEMIERLHKRISDEFKTKFSDLCRNETERKTIAVSFLAVLELFKQGTILIRQDVHFAEIEIEAERLSTPDYK